MALKLDDEELRGHQPDDNDPGWYRPYKDGAAQEREDDDGTVEGGGKKKALDNDELRDAESEPADSGWETNVDAAAPEQEKVDEAAGKRQRILSQVLFGKRAGNKDQKKSRIGRRAGIALFGVGAGVSALGVIAIIIVLFSALKLPHFAENITTYHMARQTRLFNRTSSQWSAERIQTAIMDDSRVTVVRERYQNLRGNTWGRFDQYRPQKVLENLHGTSRLSYEYGPPEGLLQRERLKAIIIDGERIPVADERFGRLVSNYRDKIRFSAQLDANLNVALKENKTLVRSAVAKKIRTDLGIKLRWWEKKAANYKKGMSQAEADRIIDREAHERITKQPGGRALNSDVEDTADEVAEQIDDCVESDDCLDNIKRLGGELPPEIDDAILNGIGDSNIERAVGTFSTVNAVVVPLCMIYEGSIQRADTTIDAQSAALQSNYYGVSSAADQQKVGDTNGVAVGAFNRKVGNVGASNPMLRRSGEAINTADYVGPQASTTGDYSVMDALLPSEVNSFFEPLADEVCPVVTDVWVGAGLAIAEIIGGFFTGGGTTAASQGVKAGVSTYLRQLAGSFFSKKGLRRLVAEGAAIGGTTLLARMLVLSRMGAQYHGLARDVQFANQADMGGKLSAEEQNRRMFYGRPLTAAEIAEDQSANLAFLQTQNAQQGSFERYASLSNPNSLLASSVVRVGSSLNTNTLTRLPANLASAIPTSVASLTTPFTRTARAADPAGDYNIINWSYSTEEEVLIETEPGYYPLENQRILDESNLEEEIKGKYDKCFTESMGKIIAEGWVVREKNGEVIEDEGDCSPEQLGLRNQDYGDLVFRWRLANRNNNSLQHLLDIQNAGGGAQTTYEAGTVGPIVDLKRSFRTAPILGSIL